MQSRMGPLGLARNTIQPSTMAHKQIGTTQNVFSRYSSFLDLLKQKSFLRARKNTKTIESADDLQGYYTLKKEDKKEIDKLIKALSDGNTLFAIVQHSQGA